QHENTVGVGLLRQVSPISYLLTESRVIFTYFRLLVYPFPQSLEYDFPWIKTVNMLTIVRIMGVLAAIGCGLWLARSRQWRITGLSILAFFVLLAPTSTFLPSADPAFEHRLYIPMLAFAVFAASLLTRLKRPKLVVVSLMTV